MDNNDLDVFGLGNDRSTIFAGSTGDEQLLLDPSDRLPGLGGPQYPELQMQGSNLLGGEFESFLLGAIAPLDVTLANNEEGSLVLDIDRNGRLEALTDGIMIIRHLFGFSGDVVVRDAVAPDGTRTDAAEITSHLDELGLLLDVDGDSQLTALTDGIMIIRDLFGFAGDVVVQNAVAPGATRDTAEAVTEYLEFLKNLTDEGPTPVNQPPVAVDDSFSIIQGTPDAQLAVLNNDSDPDGDVLSITDVADPSNGTVSINGDRVVYNPEAGFLGIDTFTYDISDGNGGTDRATVEVTVTETPTPTITWVGESGFWDDAENWSTGEVPGADDIVLIDVPGDQTITYREGATTVTTIFSEENLRISEGSFTVTGQSVVNGDLRIDNGGSLTASGAQASWVANEAVVLDGASLFALEGATISLPGATRFRVQDEFSTSNFFRASGTGSTLDLSNITSLAGAQEESFTYLRVQAEEGGQIDLSGVTEITGPSGGSNSPRGIQILADGTGSEVDLSSLTRFTNNAPTPDSRLAALNGGQVLADNLTVLNSVDIDLDDIGTLPTAQITTYNEGTFTVEGTDDQRSVNLSSLSDIDFSRFVVQNGSTLELPAVIGAIEGSSFTVENGSTISLPGVTSFRVQDEFSTSNFFRASGTGSTLDLSNITSLAGAQEESFTYLRVQAEEGGQIDLSGVTEITGPSGGSNSPRGIQILADGTGSEVDLSSLTRFTNNAPTPDSRLAALNGGQVLADNLTVLNSVDIDLDDIGTLPTAQITTYNEGTFTVEGTDDQRSVNLSSLSDIDFSRFVVQNGSTLELPAVIGAIEASSFTVENGSTISLPGVTSFRVQDEFSTSNFFRASGTGSTLDLSNITSLAGAQEESFTYLRVQAEEGGQIDLSGVTEITGPSGGSNSPRGIQILADGTGSEVDLSSLTSFTNNAPTPDSRLAALNDGQVLADNLTVLNGIDIDLDDVDRLPTSQIATYNEGTFTVEGTDDQRSVNLSSLSDIDFSRFVVQNGSTLELPAVIGAIEGSSFTVENGSTISLPGVTSFRVQDEFSTSNLFRASGTGSTLDLSNITSLAGAREESFTYLRVQAEEGGQIDLSGVTEITGPSGGSNSPRGIQILANGTGSEVDLSSLTSFTNDAPTPDSRLATVNGGTILADNLTIIDGVVVEI